LKENEELNQYIDNDSDEDNPYSGGRNIASLSRRDGDRVAFGVTRSDRILSITSAEGMSERVKATI
jgi:hypothetical protein